MVVIDGMAHRETSELGREEFKAGTRGIQGGHQRAHHVNLHSDNGGSLGCSLAERPFPLVLPEPILGGQYIYGLALLVSRGLWFPF